MSAAALGSGDSASEMWLSENPISHQQSTAWSASIHQDPSVENVYTVIDEAFRCTLAAAGRLEHASGSLAAAQMARAVVARTVAHLETVQLAPLVTQLLEGNESAIDAMLRDGRLAMLDPSTPGLTTDFGRVWYGDDARLLLGLGLQTEEPNEQTLAQLPSGIRAGMLRTGIMISWAAFAVMEHRGLTDQLSNLKLNGTWGDKPMGHYALGRNALSEQWAKKGRWRERYLIDSIAAGISTDAKSFIDRNTKTSIEHITGFLTDIVHGFLTFPDATPSDILATIAANLHLAHLLAFMSNERNGEAEYEDRYVWKGPDGLDRLSSRREPLVHVVRKLGGYALHVNPRSKLANVTRGRRGKCPGPDALKPLEHEAQIMHDLHQAATAVVRPEDLASAHLDRDFSHVDTVTLLAAVATKLLMERRIVSFRDVSRYLGPPEQATSSGPYILDNKPPRRG